MDFLEDFPLHPHPQIPSEKNVLQIIVNASMYLKTLENYIIGLRESNDEHAVYDAKSHQILGQHSIDHNDHRPNQFKSSAEEEKVKTIGEHDKLHDGILYDVQTEHPCRNTEL